jgi:hypothetical protein
MVGDDSKRWQQRQRIEGGHGSAALESLYRHVKHGEMVSHEEGVEPPALQRLSETFNVLEIEVRIRPCARIAPGGGMNTDRPHERAQA